MTPSALFDITGPLAMLGWLMLALYPLSPRWIGLLAGRALPLALSLAYIGLILAFWAETDGGFDSLTSVMALFDTPGTALAGWTHFLAFDLFVGAWIAADARRRHIPHPIIVPCLGLTFLFGPAGLVAYIAIRSLASLRLVFVGDMA